MSDPSSRLVAASEAGDNSAPLTISEISASLKRTVEDRFGYVRLRGELSGVKRAASGHLYLALKDEKAVLDGVMWKGSAGRLPFRPEDGLEVVASGKLTTYPGRSKYQIVIERMEMAGEGALLALLEKTKARLEAEGLFAPSRKRALPFAPRTIGVVTSPTGAVIRDILHRLEDRFPTRVIVWGVPVQGAGADAKIAAAVRGFGALDGADRPDLVIVARGGGSIEDLWNFNEEAVVRAVAECPIPIISAVGHETDTTLCDHAADRRAPTPTAAAEMAVPVLRDVQAGIDDLVLRERKVVTRPLELGRERLQGRADRLPGAQALLQPHAQRLDDLAERLRRGLMDRSGAAEKRLARLRLSPALLRSGLAAARQRVAGVRLSPRSLQRQLAEGQRRLDALDRLRLQLDPKAPLARGYALVTRDDGGLVTSSAEARATPAMTLQFGDGSVAITPAGAGQAPPTPQPRKPRGTKRAADIGTAQPKLL